MQAATKGVHLITELTMINKAELLPRYPRRGLKPPVLQRLAQTSCSPPLDPQTLTDKNIALCADYSNACIYTHHEGKTRPHRNMHTPALPHWCAQSANG